VMGARAQLWQQGGARGGQLGWHMRAQENRQRMVSAAARATCLAGLQAARLCPAASGLPRVLRRRNAGARVGRTWCVPMRAFLTATGRPCSTPACMVACCPAASTAPSARSALAVPSGTPALLPMRAACARRGGARRRAARLRACFGVPSPWLAWHLSRGHSWQDICLLHHSQEPHSLLLAVNSQKKADQQCKLPLKFCSPLLVHRGLQQCC